MVSSVVGHQEFLTDGRFLSLADMFLKLTLKVDLKFRNKFMFSLFAS